MSLGVFWGQVFSLRHLSNAARGVLVSGFQPAPSVGRPDDRTQASCGLRQALHSDAARRRLHHHDQHVR